MRGKIIFVAGIAVGYVLGAKAGRERYEQIAAAASRAWNNPNVQRGVDQVEGFVKDHAPDVAELAGEGVKKVASVARSATRGAKSASSSTSRSGSNASRSRSTGTRRSSGGSSASSS